jgi:uncharacterized protein YdcH (DUF465 family)
MTHVPHDLHADFPEHSARIHDLKVGDSHFARRLGEYDEVNAAIHRAETNVEPISPDAETALRKQRAALKDELYKMLTAKA